jgi:hypothetical protein
MAFKPLIPAEKAGDVAHYWEDDGQGGGNIHSVQDVGPALELTKAMRNHNAGWSPTKELRRAAFIPNIIRDKWLNEEGWDAYRPDLYGDRLARKLNDPDWAYLRTAEWRVGLSNGKIC